MELNNKQRELLANGANGFNDLANFSIVGLIVTTQPCKGEMFIARGEENSNQLR